jgi:tRNA (guanine-N7-)-methyltransferase
MSADSRRVDTAQIEPHPRLHELLRRHQRETWRAPLHAPTALAFDRVHAVLAAQRRDLILDSGCGTGDSTLALAAHFPQHWVIGVDQSAVRLRRHAAQGCAVIGNAVLVRAELASFWRLFNAAGLHAEQHYLLYPNPWPKAAQLARRWHGHPVFFDLLRTSAHFELRSNWQVYVAEFAEALRFSGRADAVAEPYVADLPLTPFERKYRDSGHALWRVCSKQNASG